jgi:hypothetical protein
MTRRLLPDDLPNDVRDLIEPHLEPDLDRLAAIGFVIARKRDEAKEARSASSIERVWEECEEAYIGIDPANRHEHGSSHWAKPVSPEGPVASARSPAGSEHRSTAFVRLTARYVDAGAAKLGEILLPLDEKAFSFTETPLPELVEARNDTSQVVHDGMGNVPLTRPAQPGDAVPAAQPPGALPPEAASAAPPQVPLTVKDLAEENIKLAREKAKRAETRIYDWMVECQYPAEVRKVIFDAARIGVGVLKGPYARPSRDMAANAAGDGIEIEIRESVKPAARWVDPWNIFPDPACGESIQNGDYCFERDYLSERQLRELKKTPGYIGAEIDRVIEEGPDKIKLAAPDERAGKLAGATGLNKGRYEVWYYYGTLSRDDHACLCQAAGKPLSRDDVPAERAQVYAIVTLVNDCVIRASLNPLDSGALPYHSVPWQRRAGHWAGIGVAEQIVTPQKIVNAATRAMLNNAGKSAGTQIVVDRDSIVPADGSWTITPDKVWYKSGETTLNVSQAFAALPIPNVTAPLMEIVQYGLRLAEESTSIPLITQGQSGPTTPETYGAAQLQNNNANQLLRSIGYAFDDFITEPVVRQFYEWLLLDPEVPADEKGDFKINAHGSAALVERAIQDQSIVQMGTMVANPLYGGDPKKWFREFLKSKRFDPRAFTYSEEEQARLDQQPPPKPPQVQAAELATQARIEVAKIGAQTAEKRLTLDEQDVKTGATIALHELQMRRELAMMDYAARHQITLEQVKAQLARTAMTLDTQKQLSAQRNGGGRQVATPAAEPEGRAANGRAFEQ